MGIKEFSAEVATMTREQKVDALHKSLTSLWGGGGDYGIGTDAIQKDRLLLLLHDLLDAPLDNRGADQR